MFLLSGTDPEDKGKCPSDPDSAELCVLSKAGQHPGSWALELFMQEACGVKQRWGVHRDNASEPAPSML